MNGMCHRLVFLGAPGSGKGTQAALVSGKLGIPQISTGDILREEIRRGTSTGLNASAYMTSGLLVPDETVIEIVKTRLQKQDCENGFILDGFPRNLHQAETLDRYQVAIDKVLVLDVKNEILLRRLSGRRICSQCNAMFHVVYNPPAKAEICDFCGGSLMTRNDDDVQTAAKRIRLYHEETGPVIAYYEKHPSIICTRIDAGQDDHETPDIIAERITEALNQECFR
jgi:adenylate kinase